MAVVATIWPVIEKLKELFLKDIIVPRLGSEIKESIETLTKLQQSLGDQETKVFNPEFLRAIYRAEDTIDTFLKEISKESHQQNLFFKKFPGGVHLRSVFIQNKFSCKIKKLVATVKRLGENTDKKIGKMDLKEEVKELAQLILDGNRSIFNISVVDVAGSAETSELLKIYDSDDFKNHFGCRAWFQVPQDLVKERLVDDILKQVAGAARQKQNKSPQQELFNFLKKKTYLVVLIDVRTPQIWEILKSLFPSSSSGSRVILSFREADAAKCQDVKFYGKRLLLKLNDLPAPPSAESKDAGGDVDAVQSQISITEILDKEAEIVGLEDQILKLAQLTVNGSKKYFLSSVVGGEGSGKTTLVKTIYNSSYIRRNFQLRAWVDVSVSQNFDMRNVLVQILKQITHVKVEEESLIDELQSELTNILDKKSYLIVLDDVHLPVAWYELESIFSPNSSLSDSRVILITRDDRVAHSFSPSIFLHHIRPLNEDESCKLFLKKARRENSSPELLKEILKLCGGLPLAICVLGGLFSSLADSEWSTKIDWIIKKEGQQAASEERASLDPSSVWGLGYMFLPPNLKACLQYLCLFPRSYVVSVRRLLQLWLAERLVSPTFGKNIAPEDQVKKDFEQLERRNMIEIVERRSDGRAKTCRVPASLYDAAFKNAEKLGFFHFDHSGKLYSLPKPGIRRLAEHLDNHAEHLQNQKGTPSDKQYKYIKSYISFENRRGDKPAVEVGDFLKKIIPNRGHGFLRMLDLEGVYKPVLPETIGKLRLLRYVGLRWTFLDKIPESIGHLPCLETLDLKHTNISTLPKSIWKVKSLRHLFMNDMNLQMFIQKPIVKSPLTNLRTLWGLLIGSKSPPVNWLKRLSNLRKLGLTCHIASLSGVTNWIQGLTSLESLRLRSINDFGDPSDLDIGSLDKHTKLTELYLLGKLPGPIQTSMLPPGLAIFTLSLSYLSQDPMPELEKLQHLKILRLFAHSYIGEQMICHSGGFPKLRVLKLWVLKELQDWTVEVGAMPDLREIEIRNCQKLKKPFGLEKVTTLKDLTLTNMEEKFETDVRGSMPKGVNIVINPLQNEKYEDQKKNLSIQERRGFTFTTAFLRQMRHANSIGLDASECEFIIRRTQSLPRAHQVAEYIAESRPTSLESIDSYWRILDLVPVTKKQNVELSYKWFKNDDDTTSIIPEKLTETDNLQSTSFTEGEAMEKIQLPNSIADTSPSHSPSASESALPKEESSPNSFGVCTVAVAPAGPTIQVKENKQSKVYQDKKLKLKQIYPNYHDELLDYIRDIKDVAGDGNCGFRAVAELVGYRENEWLKVKQALYEELHSNFEFYRKLYGPPIGLQDVNNALSDSEHISGPDRWMTMPDMGHLIASAYNVVLFLFAPEQCLTFLPLRTVPEPENSRKHIAIGFISGNHFVEVFLKPGHPVPPITERWEVRRDSCAEGWDTMYTSRIEGFTDFVDPDVATKEHGDIYPPNIENNAVPELSES